MKIDPHCQRGNWCALKVHVLFNNVQITLILLGDPKWGADLLSCVLYIPRLSGLSRAYLCVSQAFSLSFCRALAHKTDGRTTPTEMTSKPTTRSWLQRAAISCCSGLIDICQAGSSWVPFIEELRVPVGLMLHEPLQAVMTYTSVVMQICSYELAGIVAHCHILICSLICSFSSGVVYSRPTGIPVCLQLVAIRAIVTCVSDTRFLHQFLGGELGSCAIAPQSLVAFSSSAVITQRLVHDVCIFAVIHQLKSDYFTFTDLLTQEMVALI